MDRYDQAQREMNDALFNIHQAQVTAQQALLDYGENKFSFILLRRKVQELQRELAALDKKAAMGLRLNGETGAGGLDGACMEALK